MGYKKSEISAAQIVQAAIRVLARQGYARTSLLDIAREAGMSKGAVHYHFPTKEALIEVVLTEACDTVQRRTLEAWPAEQAPLLGLRKALEALWEVRASRTDEALVVADLLAQSLSDPKLRPQLAEFYERAAEQMRTALAANLSAAGLEPRIPLDVLPRIVVGLLDGLVMQVFVDPEALRPEQVVDAIQTLAIAMLTPGPKA
ncbi:MAG: TetR/AcrR family transcriptional regulator [Myxococcales bacterium]|nr:TetR/AcrR family transcriptional regulator [Myxococcales bacterium]